MWKLFQSRIAALVLPALLAGTALFAAPAAHAAANTSGPNNQGPNGPGPGYGSMMHDDGPWYHASPASGSYYGPEYQGWMMGYGPNGYGPNGYGPNGYGPNGYGPNGYGWMMGYYPGGPSGGWTMGYDH